MPTELHVLTPQIEYPKSAHRNMANRAIESICSDMGINPKTITDTTAPTATPADVATALKMLATILKSQTQAPTPLVTAHWYLGNVARRTMLGGGGGGSTVATGATNYVEFGGRALTATENLSYCILSMAGTLSVLKIETLNSQPAGGSLVFTVLQNSAATSMTITVAGGAGAAIQSATGSVAFQAGDFMSLRAVNNNAAASAQIGSFTLEFDQVG